MREWHGIYCRLSTARQDKGTRWGYRGLYASGVSRNQRLMQDFDTFSLDHPFPSRCIPVMSLKTPAGSVVSDSLLGLWLRPAMLMRILRPRPLSSVD